MPTPRSFYVVLVTCASLEEARKIATAVVEERLAACVNIHTAPVESIYRWQGKLETAREFLLLIKTTKQQLSRLRGEVQKLHSYQTPEFLVLPVHSGSRAYLDWLAASASELKRKAKPGRGPR